ncbi:unnamed protein product, partial [Owenia fusiformis]
RRADHTLHVPLHLNPGYPLCPVHAILWAFQCTSQSPTQGPAFVITTKQSLFAPLTYSFFTSRLRSCLNAIGLPGSSYSGHSFRRGGASFALSQNASHELIRIQGNWRSDCYKEYLTFSDNKNKSCKISTQESPLKTYLPFGHFG